MVKSCIFDNAGMLKRHPEIPYYKEDVVCFESVYGDRNYPEGEAYFNRELYLIFILEGRSEILLNGEHIVMEAGNHVYQRFLSDADNGYGIGYDEAEQAIYDTADCG